MSKVELNWQACLHGIMQKLKHSITSVKKLEVWLIPKYIYFCQFISINKMPRFPLKINHNTKTNQTNHKTHTHISNKIQKQAHTQKPNCPPIEFLQSQLNWLKNGWKYKYDIGWNWVHRVTCTLRHSVRIIRCECSYVYRRKFQYWPFIFPCHIQSIFSGNNRCVYRIAMVTFFFVVT